MLLIFIRMYIPRLWPYGVGAAGTTGDEEEDIQSTPGIRLLPHLAWAAVQKLGKTCEHPQFQRQVEANAGLGFGRNWLGKVLPIRSINTMYVRMHFWLYLVSDKWMVDYCHYHYNCVANVSLFLFLGFVEQGPLQRPMPYSAVFDRSYMLSTRKGQPYYMKTTVMERRRGV